MKQFVLVLFSLWFTACSTGGSKNAPAADFSAYSMSKTSDSPLQKATKLTSDNTLAEEGTVWEGQKSGTWTTYYENGRVKSITNYVNGLKEGLHLEFSDKCVIMVQATYAQDQLHGLRTKYVYANRREEEAHYSHGILDGVFKSFDKLGKVQREIHYKNGKLHGPNIFFNEDGEKTMEYEYKDGEKISGGIIE